MTFGDKLSNFIHAHDNDPEAKGTHNLGGKGGIGNLLPERGRSDRQIERDDQKEVNKARSKSRDRSTYVESGRGGYGNRVGSNKIHDENVVDEGDIKLAQHRKEANEFLKGRGGIGNMEHSQYKKA